jgi:hypothetical protein
MVCRSACETQDHSSYGECCRAANVAINGFGDSGAAAKAHDAELASYRAARAQGIQPKSTRSEDVAQAVAASNVADRPWNARENRFG